jgi:hypothetical protein
MFKYTNTWELATPELQKNRISNFQSRINGSIKYAENICPKDLWTMMHKSPGLCEKFNPTNNVRKSRADTNQM